MVELYQKLRMPPEKGPHLPAGVALAMFCRSMNKGERPQYGTYFVLGRDYINGPNTGKITTNAGAPVPIRKKNAYPLSSPADWATLVSRIRTAIPAQWPNCTACSRRNPLFFCYAIWGRTIGRKVHDCFVIGDASRSITGICASRAVLWVRADASFTRNRR